MIALVPNNPTPFPVKAKTLPRCLGARVDWMTWSGRVELDAAAMGELETRAKVAETHGRAAHDIGPYTMEVTRKNRGTYELYTEGVKVSICPNAPGGEKLVDLGRTETGEKKEIPGWTVVIDLQGKLCAELGLTALTVAWKIARAFGRVMDARLARIDLAADFVNLGFQREDIANLVKRARKAPESVEVHAMKHGVEVTRTVGTRKDREDDQQRDLFLVAAPLAPLEREVDVRFKANRPTSSLWLETAKLPVKQSKLKPGDMSVAGVLTEDTVVRVHSFGSDVGSIIIGKGTDIQVTAYDKTAQLLVQPPEVREREYKRWSMAQWAGDRVDRLEFRVRGEAMKELDARAEVHAWQGTADELVGKQIDMVRHMVPSLWSYLVGSSSEVIQKDCTRYALARRLARKMATWWSVTYKDGKFHKGEPCGVPPNLRSAMVLGGALDFVGTQATALDLFDEDGRARAKRRRVAWIRLIIAPTDPKARRTRQPTDPRWDVVQRVPWFSFAEQPPRARKCRYTGTRSAAALGGVQSSNAYANELPELVWPDGTIITDEDKFVASLGTDLQKQEWLERQIAKQFKMCAKRVARDIMADRTIDEACIHYAVRHRAAKAKYPNRPLAAPGIHKALPPNRMKFVAGGQRTMLESG